MADPAEVTTEAVTREHVVRRVDDWVRRVEGLYRLVKQWLPAGWSSTEVAEIRMDEEMMRKFGVEPHVVPILELTSKDGRLAKFEPRALWIIGANGRVDLYCGKKHFIILDKSNRFEPPDWHMANFTNRSQVEKFDQARLVDALAP